MSVLSAIPKVLHEVQEVSETLEGGQYIVLLLWLSGAMLVHFEWKETLELLGIVVPLTFVLYRLGSSLDDLLFDPVFKPEMDDQWGFGWLGSSMRRARRNAACFMQSGKRNCATEHRELEDHKVNLSGIYRRSETLYRGTMDWKQQVHWRIKLSKAARCLVIPAGLIFIYDCWPSFLPRLTASNNVFGAFAFLTSRPAQWASLLLCIFATAAYVLLRLAHMKALYQLVSTDARFRSVPLALTNAGPEETLMMKGCLYFIGRRDIRQVVHKQARYRYSAVLLLRGTKYQRA